MPKFETLIRHDQPLVTGAMAKYPYSKKLERMYRFSSRYDDEVLLHSLDGMGHIYLPRALCPVGVIDERDEGEDVVFPKGPTPRDHQVELYDETASFLKQGLSGVVVAYTGWGKSKHPDEPMLMFDGTIKKARDVQVGDQVMGPDSKPRNVTNVNFGYGPMVRVVPVKGDPWKCNDVHILSLKCTSDNHYGYKDQLVNVTVKEWLSWPAGKKHVFKLWRVGVDFAEAKQRIDPYFMGVLLGDGCLRGSINVTTMDPEIVEEVYRQAASYGCSVRIDNSNTGKAATYFLTQKRGANNTCALRTELHQLGLTETKHVPKNYKVASRDQRLQLLAGLLDTDGYLNAGVFEIAAKSNCMAEDIVFVARSLGFGVGRGEKLVNGVSYARITIYGDTHLIPTRLPRKKALPRRQVKNVLRTGFKIELLPDGEYRGISLDGDHLYLLGDFTVTHNTTLGYHAAFVTQKKTLVITTKDDIYQKWIEGAGQFLGLKPHEIGEIRQDKCEVIGTKFVVAMIHSLSKDGKYPDWIVKGFGLVIFDECFTAATEVLTRNGWVSIANVPEGSEVMAFDGVTGTSRFEQVTGTVHKQFSGSLTRIRGQKFDILTTPGHGQPVQRKRKTGFELDRVEVKDLCLSSSLRVPVAAPLEGAATLSDFDRIRIAFEADGHHLYTSKKTGLHTYRFAFRRPRKIARLKELLNILGITFGESVNARGDTCITFKLPDVLSKSFDWYDIFVGGLRNYQFLQELAVWDGHLHADGRVEWQNPDEGIVRWMQTLAQLAGCSASVNKYGAYYRLMVSPAQTWLDSSGLHQTTENYDGMVHCVAVPSGNLVVRYNGVVSISGNCHRVPAESFSSVAGMFPAKLRLGMSATPHRPDGKENLVFAHVGPIRAQTEAQLMIPKILRVHSNWTCPRVFKVSKKTGKKNLIRLPHTPGKTAHIEKIVAADPTRNQMIGELVKAAYDAGRRTVIFSTLHDHLRALAKVIHQLGVPTKDVGFYVGAQGKQELELREKAKGKPVILTTYVMMGEGTDIPWLDTCVLAMPRANVEQPIGRIRREYPGKKPPVVFDIMDGDSPVFSGYSGARRSTYRKIGCVVKEY